MSRKKLISIIVTSLNQFGDHGKCLDVTWTILYQSYNYSQIRSSLLGDKCQCAYFLIKSIFKLLSYSMSTAFVL